VGIVFSSCVENKQTSGNQAKEPKSMELFQGIWLDDDSESVLFKVKGDTIFYADNQNMPVYFQIRKDSIYMYGSEVFQYKIDKQTEYSFWFHSSQDNIIKLHKSESEADSLAFINNTLDLIPIVEEVIQRDTIVNYQGRRFRAYTYINPSNIKVFKTTHSEEGLSVDHVYYDNIMYICIYEGKEKLFASNITKDHFKDVVPSAFLEKSIMADMNFYTIDKDGYHYTTNLCIPESSVCYIVDLNIGFNDEINAKLIE